MYASDASRNPLQSCLVFHSILDLLLKTPFGQTFTHLITFFFIIFGETQYWKEHEKKRWETCRRPAGEIAFVYQNNKTNESVTFWTEQIMVIYILKINGERLYISGKTSFLDLEPLTMIHALCHFSPLMILRIRKYLSMFSFLWTISSVNRNSI